MRAELRTLLTDIKAAARIGHADSLAAALDGLLDLPEVAGNPQLSEAFINQLVLPAGHTLANPRLQLAMIQPLGKAPYAILRAICAVALADRHFAGEAVEAEQLAKLGRDPRQDVRQALQLVLAEHSNQHSAALLAMIPAWLGDNSPRLQALAIRLLPSIQPETALDLLHSQPPPSDPELRAALAEALTALAQDGHSQAIFKLMQTWSSAPDSYLWAICKALSSSWAAQYPAQSLNTLKALGMRSGPHKQITNSLQALSRHGAQAQVAAWLQEHPQFGEHP